VNHTGKRSLRGAINAFCRHCIHDPHSGGGTWREQVTACTATACPLYPVRPLAKGQGCGEKVHLERSEARSAPDPYDGKGSA
jgi:hypothetical protein